MRWWWLGLAGPVAALVLFEWVLGDRLLGVRRYRPPPPADDRPDDRDEIARAFRGDPAPDPPADVVAFLRALDAAAGRGRPTAVTAAFDADRLFDQLSRSAPFRRSQLPYDPTTGGGLVRQALWAMASDGGLGWGPRPGGRPAAAAAGWAALATGNRWHDGVEVRAVWPLPRDGEVVAYARHFRAGDTVPVRWWLTRTPLGLRAFDVEDLRYEVRLSREVAERLSDTGDGEPGDPANAAATALRRAAALLAVGRPDEADAALSPARSVTLPPGGFGLRCVLEGQLAAARGNPAAALTWADRAAGSGHDSPAADFLRAAAHASAGRWAEAIRDADRYAARVGPDAASSHIRTAALNERARPETIRTNPPARQSAPTGAFGRP